MGFSIKSASSFCSCICIFSFDTSAHLLVLLKRVPGPVEIELCANTSQLFPYFSCLLLRGQLSWFLISAGRNFRYHICKVRTQYILDKLIDKLTTWKWFAIWNENRMLFIVSIANFLTTSWLINTIFHANCFAD